jgi:hypothetical protein
MITLFGNLLPIFIGILFDIGFEKWSWVDFPSTGNGFYTYYKDGQGYLYCASLLTSSAYIFYTFKEKNTDLNSMIFWISLLCIFVASVLYAIFLAGGLKNRLLLRNSSLLFFLISIFIYYFSNYVNNKRIDVNSIHRQQIDAIKEQL